MREHPGHDGKIVEACWDFMEYQINASGMFMGDKDAFERDGFQIGSP